jgi:hypothetical protein
MRGILAIGFACALVAGAVQSASAGVRTPRVNYREHHQQERIEQGIRSGELTRHEAQRLEAEEGVIRANEAVDRADGRVTRAERRQLNRELDRTNRQIYRQKHDGQGY